MVVLNGAVVEYGPADTIFAAPKHDYTRALTAAAFHLEAVDSELVGM